MSTAQLQAILSSGGSLTLIIVGVYFLIKLILPYVTKKSAPPVVSTQSESSKRILEMLNSVVEQTSSLPALIGSLTRTIHQIAELHEWHKETDADGVKKWYFRRSHEDAIKNQTQVMAENTAALQAMQAGQNAMVETLKELVTEIRTRNIK